MIGEKKVLAVVPARGGSKGVPGKNIKPLGGKPLIAWTLMAASCSRYIDRCVVSTDSPEIASVARQYGGEVPFMRPQELALDTSPGIDPVLHVLDNMEGYDIVVLLQPTSPFRTVEDIDRCIEQFIGTDANSVVTLVQLEKPLSWMYTMTEMNGQLQPLLPDLQLDIRRQDARGTYALNGAVYVASCSYIQAHKSFIGEKTFGMVMPPARSIDIDSPLDFCIAESMIQLSLHKEE